jgi:hypothetical protein
MTGSALGSERINLTVQTPLSSATYGMPRVEGVFPIAVTLVQMTALLAAIARGLIPIAGALLLIARALIPSALIADSDCSSPHSVEMQPSLRSVAPHSDCLQGHFRSLAPRFAICGGFFPIARRQLGGGGSISSLARMINESDHR